MTKDKLGWMAMFMLSKPHGVRFTEIQEQWRKNNIGVQEKDLQYRTFYNWCCQMKDGGRYYIECDKKENKYYIRPFDDESIESEQIPLISYSLTDYDKIRRALDNMTIQHRIVKDPTFAAEETLDIISTSMRENKALHICYEKFGEEGYEIDVHPYALRLCERRWYLIAYCPKRRGMRTYAIDRLPCCTILNRKFKMPEDFNAEEYFEDCVGVFKGIKKEESTPARVLLKATHQRSEYLQTLPLHCSQKLILENSESSVFSYWLRPTDELATRILSMGDEVEVLEPQSLRDKVREKIERMRALYLQK